MDSKAYTPEMVESYGDVLRTGFEGVLKMYQDRIEELIEENETLKEEYEMIRVGLCIELDKLKEVQGYIIEANNEESKKLKAENETLKEELNDANKLIEHLDQDKD